jgi:acetyl-CoA carboxylase biotin carboxyl carrier protein
MGLSDDDVTEILRIVDEARLAELTVKTRGFELHVRRETAEAEAEAETAPAPTASASASASGSTESIPAPMLGIFYVADAPGEPPFVEVGAQVEPETVVGIIEVMKMMNTVQAGLSGTIVEICVENAELVEDGQTLFKVAAA